MTRARLASFLTVVLALSGAWAGPVRAVESTRLIASIVCVADERDEVPARQTEQTSLSRPPSAVAIGQPTAVFHRPYRLPHVLFQRPPPHS